jgi:hypothetical protein
MADSPYRAALRQRWLAEYGERFSAAEIESALDDVDTFRRCAARLRQTPLDLGEMPFSCVLPPARGSGSPR